MEQAWTTSRASRRLMNLAIVAPILIAVTALIGWAFGIPYLFELVPGLATMKVNAAICVILCAAGLGGAAARSPAWRSAGVAASGAAIAIAGATLTERMFDVDLGIDELLLTDWRSASRLTPPGRMSVAASLGLVLVSAGTVGTRRWPRAGQLLALGGVLIGYVSLVGHLFDVEALFRVSPFGAISTQTAGCIVVLGLGVLGLRPRDGLTAPIVQPGPGRELAVRLLPIAILLSPAIGFLLLEGELAGVYDTSFGFALTVVVIAVGATALIFVSASALNRSTAAHEAAIQREGELRDRIISSAIFGIVVIDADGIMRVVNPRYCELTGYSAEELVGRHFDLVIPPANRDAARTSFAENLARSDSLQDVEFEVRRKDGATVTVLYGLAPLPGRGGIVANLVDISDRKRLEAQLLQAQKLEGIGRLAGGVAHDFNNILTAIYGDAAFVQSAAPPGTPIYEHAEHINRHAQRAAELTRQLLSFARKQMVVPKVINLGERVRAIEPMLRRLIPENIELITRESDTRTAVLADAGQIEQILVNLAVNARDAMPDGGRLTIETGRISLDAAAVATGGNLAIGENAFVAVSDTGVGMDESTRERIFEPFFTTKELGRGTGLGLSTVYGLVQQFGGSIAVTSQPGRGTAFRIYLPLACGEPEPPIRSRPARRPPEGSATILLAEDERDVREVIAASLRSLGYTVLTAENGEGGLAVAAAATKPIDLLISDALMPGMSGRDLAARLRERWPTLRILLISGYTEEIAGQMGPNGADIEFLPKPFATSRLAEKVAEMLTSPMDAGSRGN